MTSDHPEKRGLVVMRRWLSSTRFRRRINVTMMVIPPTETLPDRGLLPPTCHLRTHTPSRNVPFRMRDKLWSFVRGKGKGFYCGVLQHLALKRIGERRSNRTHCIIDPTWICVLRHNTAAVPRKKGSWKSWNRLRDVNHRQGRRFGEDKNFLFLRGFRFRSLGLSVRRPSAIPTELPRRVRNSILRFNDIEIWSSYSSLYQDCHRLGCETVQWGTTVAVLDASVYTYSGYWLSN